VLGLWSVAFAQPVFEALRSNAHFFVARRSPPSDIILLTLSIALLPPLAMLALELASGRISLRAGRIAHRASIGTMLALIVLFATVRGLGAPDALGLAAGVAAGVLGAIGYSRAPAARSFAALLAPLALVFPLLFLLRAPIAELVDPAEAALPAAAKNAPDTPIVIVVFDELPLISMLDAEQRIDAARAPSFAALAAHASWFRNASTVADGTAEAVPAILTGRRPRGRVLPTFEAQPHNLFSLLSTTHRIRALESVTWLCPDVLCERVLPPLSQRMLHLHVDAAILSLRVLLPDSLTRGLPRVDDRWANFARISTETTLEDQLRSFLSGFERSARGTLDYLHVLTPHGPWEHLPSGQRYGSYEALRHPAGLSDGVWSEEPGFALRGLQRHTLEVGYADHLLGRLIDRLVALDLYDASLIVVLADHGVSFMPGQPWRRVTPENHVELMSIPMLVKAPGQRSPAISDRNVETIDLLPTLAELLGVTLPWPVDGHSALDVHAPARDAKTISRAHVDEELRFADISAERRALSAERIALVGAGADASRLYRAGPRPELVGASVAQIEALADPGPEIVIEGSEAFEQVSLDADHLPIWITGQLSTEAERAPDVAIVVEGVVRAVTAPYREGEGWRFTALIPPSSLRQGANRVRAIALSSPRLAP
jgi:hypothetical protein